MLMRARPKQKWWLFKIVGDIKKNQETSVSLPDSGTGGSSLNISPHVTITSDLKGVDIKGRKKLLQMGRFL